MSTFSNRLHYPLLGGRKRVPASKNEGRMEHHRKSFLQGWFKRRRHAATGGQTFVGVER